MTTHIHYPSIAMRLGDGSTLVKPGKPVTKQELGTGEFSKLVGLAQRTVQIMCDEGRIKCRKMTTRDRSHYLIPVEEVSRFKKDTEI